MMEMASNVVRVVREVMDGSHLKRVEIAEMLGISPQRVSNLVSERTHADMPAGTAAKLLDLLGYQLVAVPKGKRLPDGSVTVDPA